MFRTPAINEDQGLLGVSGLVALVFKKGVVLIGYGLAWTTRTCMDHTRTLLPAKEAWTTQESVNHTRKLELHTGSVDHAQEL